MLVNPYTEPNRVVPYNGTHLLQDNLGVQGREVHEPGAHGRLWCVYSLFAPLPSRALGGIRAKLIDEKNFITFCNQRDLEVLLGIARPGDWCRWAGSEYVGPDHPEWFGLCADDDDLLDDLQERELMLRSNTPGGVLSGHLEIVRRVHIESKYDAEELFILLGDYDHETGHFPDMRLETIERRWTRSHRERLRWDRI